MTWMPRFPLAAAVLVLLLSVGCTAGPEPRPAQQPAIAPEAMVAAIRAAGDEGEDAVAVHPLRDPRVEDLRAEAEHLQGVGDVDGAARALDRALEVVDNDPALLQERAELAVLQGEYARAGQLAERAHALGARVGPLCRRHWATLEQLRLREGDAASAAAARTRLEACRVSGPVRY